MNNTCHGCDFMDREDTPICDICEALDVLKMGRGITLAEANDALNQIIEAARELKE